MMLRILTSILVITLSLALTSCDDMFSEWIGDASENADMSVSWKSLDPFNISYGVYTMNGNPGASASSPRLAVYNGTLYAAWVEGEYITIRQFGGNESNPEWYYINDIYVGYASSLTLFPSNFGLLVAYTASGSLTVQTIDNIYLGSALQYAYASKASLVELNGTLYAVWDDNGIIRAKYCKYDPGTSSYVWTQADYGDINGSSCSVKSSGGYIYITCINGQYLNVYRYNGYEHGSWEQVYYGMNFYTTSPGTVSYHDIDTYKGQPYVTWIEYYYPSGYSYNRINVRSASGKWIDGYHDSDYDGIPDFNGGLKWGGITSPLESMDSVNINGCLCVFWIEETYDEFSTIFTTVRASLYNGGWIKIDGNGIYGLASGHPSPSSLNAVAFDDGAALIYLDASTGYANVHVMAGK